MASNCAKFVFAKGEMVLDLSHSCLNLNFKGENKGAKYKVCAQIVGCRGGVCPILAGYSFYYLL